MIIQILSDLHAAVSPPPPIEISDGVDAVVVAGDTCQGAVNAFVALRRIAPEAIRIATMKNPVFDPAILVEITV